ncbi:DUF4255 domain-containing protein [Streptomyces sp. NPDC059994]|uniref:DUF4255 domain-containing protein n=1 Tax=Streptomyces sp. NPDC059994 TaxID=3347029 RepID=UPI003691E22D
MSDSFAVAAVTDTLRAILQGAVGRQVPGAVVTARPPDEVTADRPTAALNVFLYRASVDGSWRNLDPVGTRPGETGRPALPLVLHYLLTPYASGDAQESTAQRILGAAMLALHDHAVLGPEEVRRAAPFSDLHLQSEAVRITPVAVSTDDISKLWTAFQSQYRTSVAYEARIVLIDSSLPGRAPLPVLARGDQDRGPEAAANTAGPLPTLTGMTPGTVRPGDELTVTGTRFDEGDALVLRLTHPLLGGPVDVAPREATAAEREAAATKAHFELPGDLAAGTWSAAVLLNADDGSQQATRALPLGVAPRLAGPLPLEEEREADGSVRLEVRCEPPVHPGQRVQLIVGELPLGPLDAFASTTDRLRFRWPDARPGRHALRLRVDDVESLPAVDATGRPEFPTDAVVVVA